MNRISFNPSVATIQMRANINAKAENKNNNLQRVNITALPSFGALKPLTEEQKCKKMLLQAKTDRGTLRFPTNDEITDMMKLIKEFKTDVPKSKLLKAIFDPLNDGDISYLATTETICDYFKYLSGKPSKIQKGYAYCIGSTDTQEAADKISLIKNGILTDKDLEFIDKKLTNDDDFNNTKIDALTDAFVAHNSLVEQKKLLVDKANLLDKAPAEVINNFRRLTTQDVDPKYIPKVLKLFNKDNVETMGKLIDGTTVRTKAVKEIIYSRINKSNLAFLAEVADKAHPRDIVADLNSIKKGKTRDLIYQDEYDYIK